MRKCFSMKFCKNFRLYLFRFDCVLLSAVARLSASVAMFGQQATVANNYIYIYTSYICVYNHKECYQCTPPAGYSLDCFKLHWIFELFLYSSFFIVFLLVFYIIIAITIITIATVFCFLFLTVFLFLFLFFMLTASTFTHL